MMLDAVVGAMMLEVALVGLVAVLLLLGIGVAIGRWLR